MAVDWAVGSTAEGVPLTLEGAVWRDRWVIECLRLRFAFSGC
jgi:hypothetical protein